MDHRVSKDMISSGMTPSGEKTQADLGKTQYGSAPSPSKLMDAYHSMYQNQKEETLQEGKIPAGLQAYLDKKKGKKKDDDDGDEKKDKKDVKEGAGLYANIHAKRKRGGKMRKKGAKGAPSAQDFANAAKTAKEEVDKFDIVFNHFVSEGYSEKEIYAKMSNLTEEQLDEFMKALATRAAKYGANLGQKSDIFKRQPFEPAARARKPFDAKPKPGDLSFKPTNPSDVVTHSNLRKKAIATQDYSGRTDIAKPGEKTAPTSKSTSSSGNTTIKPQQKKKNLLSTDNLVKAQIASSMLSGGGGQQKKKAGQVSSVQGPSQAGALSSIRRSRGQVMQDSFDLISNELIKEGYSEKETYKIMANLTEDQIEELNEEIISGTLATLGVLGKILGAGATKAAVAGKGLATAAKGTAMAAKKGVVSTAKNVMTGTKDVANKAMGKIKNIAKPPSKGPKITSSGGNIVQGGDQAKNKILSTDNIMKTQIASTMLSGGGGQKKQTAGTVSASADLFDIVKGQLLDEGLSEEEIRDIMTTLTPEEIMNEMNQGPSTPVKNYGDSPNKPKILPNFGATRAKVRTTDKGTIIKGGKDTGKTAAQMSQEEYKNFDPKKPDPKQMAAQAKQEKNRQKFNDPMGVKNKNIGGQGLDPMDK